MNQNRFKEKQVTHGQWKVRDVNTKGERKKMELCLTERAYGPWSNLLRGDDNIKQRWS